MNEAVQPPIPGRTGPGPTPLRVAVHGARGRMGSLTVAAIRDAEGLEVAAEIGRGDDLPRALDRAAPDVFIDFTVPEAVFDAVRGALTRRIPAVIGTSGLSADAIPELESIARETGAGCLLVPNFSVGAVLLMRLAREAARVLGRAEILEMHHDGKKDAPSATSIHTARIIADAATPHGRPARQEEETIPGSRGAEVQGVRIHSVRLPGLLAHQEVLFGAQGQTLTLRHDTLDRSAFVPGILLALEKAPGIDGLVVGLEPLLP